MKAPEISRTSTGMRLRLLAAAALLLMLLAAGEGAHGISTYDHGRLWRISRPGLADSFVLGTIHVADARVSPVTQPVAEALASSRTLAMELLPVAVDASEVEELETLPDGGRLAPLVGDAAYARLRSELLAQGIADSAIERMKPWAAMLRVARIAPQGDLRSLDENVFAAARARRMRIASLEGVEEQALSFDAVPLASQVALLVHALEHRAALAAMTEPTIATWLRGDLAALARAPGSASREFPTMRQHYEQLARHAVHDRTVVLHHRLVLPLREGRVFVAVGAAHLQGDAGLLAMLRRDGYAVSRIW
jgi:uncharacterized protein